MGVAGGRGEGRGRRAANGERAPPPLKSAGSAGWPRHGVVWRRAVQPGGREEEEKKKGKRRGGSPLLHGGVQPGLREGREGIGASRCPMALAEGAAVPYAVELGLTVLHTALYAALFLFAYLQLWLLLYYRERRLSYHTLCLFLCLLWAALRTTLFSFYLQNSLQALRLQQPFAHWLLYCLPGCLLFSSLCLLNLYFAEVSFALLGENPSTVPFPKPPPCGTPGLEAPLQTWIALEPGWGCEGGRGSRGCALGGALGQPGGMWGCALNPSLEGGTGMVP